MLAGAKQPGHNGLFYTFFSTLLSCVWALAFAQGMKEINCIGLCTPPIVFHPLIYTLFDNAILERVIFYSTFNLKVSLAHLLKLCSLQW